MLDGFVGDVLLCMDDESGLPTFPGIHATDLPELAGRLLTPDQQKGFIVYADEILELAALAEMVRKYRYPDGTAGFVEELFWMLSRVTNPEGDVPLGLTIRKALREWLEEELSNSAQLCLGL